MFSLQESSTFGKQIPKTPSQDRGSHRGCSATNGGVMCRVLLFLALLIFMHAMSHYFELTIEDTHESLSTQDNLRINLLKKFASSAST